MVIKSRPTSMMQELLTLFREVDEYSKENKELIKKLLKKLIKNIKDRIELIGE